MKTKYLLAGILIILGVALLLDQYHVWTLGKIISTWWPLILIVMGLSSLLNKNSSPLTGIFILLVGLIFQLDKLDVLPGSAWGYFWPLLLIVIGVSILLSKKDNHSKRIFSNNKSISNDDFLNISTIFSGIEHRVDSKNFAGGDISCMFAGIEIDLRQCELKNNGAILDLSVAFGEIVLRVPNHFILDVSGSPFLGGFENKTRQEVTADSKILKIKYSAIFGSIEITN